MERILRTKGKTYTEAADVGDDTKLQRGLFVERQHPLSTVRANEVVPPRDLAGLLANDPMLVLRQAVSVLDKIVKKPRRSLRGYDETAYVHRVKIAGFLRDILKRNLSGAIPDWGPDHDGQFDRIWDWKVMPCAEWPINFADPGDDGNFAEIEAAKEGKAKDKWPGKSIATFEDFQGRWFQAFWPEENHRKDHKQIAERIWDHLIEKELKIDGKLRLSVKRPEDRTYGLTIARGRSIANSANDPRSRRKKDPDFGWGDDDVNDYFSAKIDDPDVAKRIFESLLEPRNTPVYGSDFGRILYEHYGKLLQLYKDRTDGPNQGSARTLSRSTSSGTG